MEITNLDLPGAMVLTPRRFGDDRGYFSEVYNKKTLESLGILHDFVQDNHSKSALVGTVRGLHYQSPPSAQTKLVRVIAGAIRDVIVDVRNGSPSFGEWCAIELDAEDGRQLLVPQGFLHGFITLKPNTEVIYKVDDYYSAECDGSVLWNDADLGIDWGRFANSAKLSEKDKKGQPFAEFDSPFQFEK